MDNQGPLSFGLLKSPTDVRDFDLGAIQPPVPIPPTFLPDISNMPIFFQGKTPACVGHGTAWAVMRSDYGFSGFIESLSPRFIYALCKRDDGVPTQDGTYYRQGFKEVQNYGVCDDPLFTNDVTLPHDTYQDASLISDAAYANAKSRMIKAYAPVKDLTLDGLKQSIYQNKLVLIGIKIGPQFWTPSWSEADVLPLKPPSPVISGHAVVAYGYDEKYIYFVNSWGKNWGRGGIGYFDATFLPYVYEGWTFVDMPNEQVQQLITERDTYTNYLVNLVWQFIERITGMLKVK